MTILPTAPSTQQQLLPTQQTAVRNLGRRVHPKRVRWEIGGYLQSTFGCGTLLLLSTGSFIAAIAALITWSSMEEVSPTFSEGFGFFCLTILGSGAAGSLGIYAARDWLRRRSEARDSAKAAEELLAWFPLQHRYLIQLLHRTHEHLERAEQEFSEKGHLSFWREVQTAAKLLEEYFSGSELLVQKAESYQSRLAGHRHTYPPWDWEISEIIDPQEAVSWLRAVGRKGETDPVFVQVFTNLMIHEAIVAGFKEITGAIQHLESEMKRSFTDLKTSIHRDLTKIISFQQLIQRSVQSMQAAQARRP